MTVQATSLGLAVHQMAGIDAHRARDVLRIPEGFEPVTAIAIGYPGEPEALPDPLRQREIAPRARRHQREIAFGGCFGEPALRSNPTDCSFPTMSRATWGLVKRTHHDRTNSWSRSRLRREGAGIQAVDARRSGGLGRPALTAFRSLSMIESRAIISAKRVCAS